MYTVMRPNLQSASAQALAEQVAQSVSAESMSIQFTMPGDVSMTVRQPIALQGSNTIFDQIFKVDSITRNFRPRSGYIQAVRASLAV